jgi:hypothetical protein
MRDLNKMIDHVERTVTRHLDAPPLKPTNPNKPRKSPASWRAPDSKPRIMGRDMVRSPDVLTARSVQLKVPLDPAEVLGLAVSEKQQRIKLTVAYVGGLLRADVAAKSLRKAQSAIRESGVESTFVMLQGKLRGVDILECGLVAQAKASPPGPADACATPGTDAPVAGPVPCTAGGPVARARSSRMRAPRPGRSGPGRARIAHARGRARRAGGHSAGPAPWAVALAKRRGRATRQRPPLGAAERPP